MLEDAIVINAALESTANLADSIKAAENELNKVQDPEPAVQDLKSVIKDPPVVKTDDTSDLTPDEQASARNLFRALKNPESARATIEMLANSVGITGKETPKQIEQVKDDMFDVLKEALGPELEFLAEKLFPAIGKIVDKTVDAKVDLRTKDIRDKINLSEEVKLQNEADTTITELSRKYFDVDELPKDVESRMSQLMDIFPPSGKMTARQYVESMFHMVVGEKGITAATKNIHQRIKRAEDNVPSRLNSSSTQNPQGVQVPTKMSLAQAIEAAEAEILGRK
jgi:hypothetical protein